MNRQEFFETIGAKLTSDQLAYIHDAYWLVKDAHRTQTRRLTGERFFEHVRRVAYRSAVTYGYFDAHMIALGLLHDTIEDTYVSQRVIVNLFGAQMYNDVLSLSKEIPAVNIITGKVVSRAKLSTDVYYGALATANQYVRVTKGSDRIDNLEDLHRWEPARREKYIIETETYVLPIIQTTDSRMADEIRQRIKDAIQLAAHAVLRSHSI